MSTAGIAKKKKKIKTAQKGYGKSRSSLDDDTIRDSPRRANVYIIIVINQKFTF